MEINEITKINVINFCPWCGVNFRELLGHPLEISQEKCKYCPSCKEDFFCPECDQFICDHFVCDYCEECESQHENVEPSGSSI